MPVLKQPITEADMPMPDAPTTDEREIAAIRAALIEGEESIKKYGYSTKTIDDIWEEAKAKFAEEKGLMR